MAIRFPSIDEAMGRAREAVRRFPFVILSGLIAATTACYAINASPARPWLRATQAALLGLPLFVTLALGLERRGVRGAAAWLARLAAVLIPVGYLVLSAGWTDTLLWTRFLHIELLLHLAVAILPFTGRPADMGFWQFNRILFLRFLTGALFTAVLFLGLALALAALNPLFGIRVDEDVFLGLFFVLAFLVSPWYFAAGVPPDLRALDELDAYPTGLRVFAQFVLMPLVVVYLTLLTLYFGRVLLTRTWPSGWIGWLVSGVAVAGTLALLLVHPLRTRGAHWVDTYHRWFYVVLLPSVGMLLAAIFQRVGQYGFTERRYFLLALALVLAGIAVYYAVTASRNIRVIPATLLAATVVTLAGPWSAYAVSRRSQTGRIIDVLERNDMLEDGRAIPAQGALAAEDRVEITGALRYLLRTHGIESVIPLLLAERTDADSVQIPRWRTDERAMAILEGLNVRYLDRLGNRNETIFVNVEPAVNTVLDVAGYDRLIEGDIAHRFAVADAADSIRIVPSPGVPLAFHIWRADTAVIRVDVSERVVRLLEARATEPTRMNVFPMDSLTFVAESERVRVKLLLQSVGAERTDSGYVVRSAPARLLLQLR